MKLDTLIGTLGYDAAGIGLFMTRHERPSSPHLQILTYALGSGELSAEIPARLFVRIPQVS